MALQNEDLRREVEKLRAENGALRHAISTSVPSSLPMASRGVYRNEALALSEVERVALGVNGLQHFPVWLAVVLHVLTFGVFSVIYYAGQGGKLPEIEPADPSPQKALLYFLLPYFNLYWLFAFPTRLADRINFQLRLRGEAPMISQALVVACSLSTALVLVPFFWIFAVIQMQQAINRIVELGPVVPREAPFTEQGVFAQQSPFTEQVTFTEQGAFAQPAAMTGVRVDPAYSPLTEPPPPAWAEEAAWQVDAARRGTQR